MIDTNKAVYDMLQAVPALLAAFGTRMRHGRLPAGWTPASGLTLTYFARGGRPESYVPLLAVSYQFTVWAASPEAAREGYRLLHDFLWSATAVIIVGPPAAFLLTAEEEVHGQDGRDPDTGWPTVTCFWRLEFRKD